jgi:ribosome-associated toxin RatA of RatAB toxin-antitoxin module
LRDPIFKIVRTKWTTDVAFKHIKVETNITLYFKKIPHPFHLLIKKWRLCTWEAEAEDQKFKSNLD